MDNGATYYQRVRSYNGSSNADWSDGACIVNDPSGPPGVPVITEPGTNASGEAITFRWDQAPRGLEYRIEIQADETEQLLFDRWLGVTDAEFSQGPGRPIPGVRVPQFPDSGHSFRYRVTARNPVNEGQPTSWRTVKNGPSGSPEAPYGAEIGAFDADGCFRLTFQQGLRGHTFLMDLSYDEKFEASWFPDPLFAQFQVPRRLTSLQNRQNYCLLPKHGHRIWLRIEASNELGTRRSSKLLIENPLGEHCAHPVFGSVTGRPGEPISTCYDEDDNKLKLVDKARREDRNYEYQFGGLLQSTVAHQDIAGIYTRWPSVDENQTKFSRLVAHNNVSPGWSWGGGGPDELDAASAHLNAAMIYDGWFTGFSLNGLGDQGQEMGSVIGVTEEVRGLMPSGDPRICPSRDGGSWDGYEVAYSIPGPRNWRAARSFDVAAHEWGHAILQTIAGIGPYPGETGSFSESFADLAAAALAQYSGRGGDPYLIGDDLGSGVIIRDMRNPGNPGALRPQPATYLTDPLWQPAGMPQSTCNPFVNSCGSTLNVDHNDSCYVHVDCGVPNKAFALMADGGTHNGISVTGQGLASIFSIALEAAAAEWRREPGQPVITFQQAAAGMISAAQRRFGSGPAQVVRDGWTAVGVIAGLTPTPAPTARPGGAGDCDGDGHVAINEVISCTLVALGLTPLSVCPNADSDSDEKVTVNDLIRAVRKALP